MKNSLRIFLKIKNFLLHPPLCLLRSKVWIGIDTRISNYSVFVILIHCSYFTVFVTLLYTTVEKYFQGVLILASVLFVLYREALVVERLRRLPRMQEVVGSNPNEGKICFSQFTLFYRVECEKLFCKTNLKL